MYTKEAIQLKFTKDIGELNKKRADIISAAIAHYYQEKDEDINDSLFFYDLTTKPDEELLEDGAKSIENGLIISPKSLTFLISLNQQHENAYKLVYEIIVKVFDTLLLETSNVGFFAEVLGKYYITGDTLEHSLRFMPEGINFSDAQGVGLRIFVDNETYTGEYKVEPLVKDTDYYFTEMQVKYKDFINIDDLTNILIKLESDIEERTNIILNIK